MNILMYVLHPLEYLGPYKVLIDLFSELVTLVSWLTLSELFGIFLYIFSGQYLFDIPERPVLKGQFEVSLNRRWAVLDDLP